jgi:hypothetical protein
MIHFDFTVDDIDAQNIVWCIRNAALQSDEYIMDIMVDPDLTEEQRKSYIDYHKTNKKYMLGLVEKMKKDKIPE